MQLQYLNLDLLDPSPWNPRFISDERFKNLCQSIRERPDMLELRPCLVRPVGDRFEVWAGNMRYRALASLYADEWMPPWGHGLVPAIVTDIPEREAKARALVDNSEWGAEDEDKTAALLQELGDDGVGLDVLGYDDARLRELLDSVGAFGDGDGSGDGSSPAKERTCPECGYVFGTVTTC